MRPGARLGEARRHSLAAALGDAPELLHVEMQQVAGGVVLVADRLPGDAVQAVEPVEAAAPQHGVDRGAGDPERPLDAMRPESLRASHGADASLQLGRRAPGMRPRGGAAVLEPCRSLRPEAPQPLGNGVAGDAEVASDLSLGPAGVHFPHELESGQRRQPRVTMGHEGVLSSLLPCCHTQQRARPLTLSTTYVGTTPSAGRDPADIDLGAAIDVAGNSLEQQLTLARQWEARGATHLALRTTRSGFEELDQHLESYRAFHDAYRG